MRVAFLVLFIANIAVLVWGTYLRPPHGMVARPPAGGNLILLTPEHGTTPGDR